MRVLCKSQLLLVGAVDQISCALDEGHDGFHHQKGTVPAYHDPCEPDESMDDPQVDYAIVWSVTT